MKKQSVSRSKRLNHIQPHELEAAKDFIQNNPVGKKLQMAEHILNLLESGTLPRVKEFIFNATFDLRQIMNLSEFNKTVEGDPKLSKLLDKSHPNGFVRIQLEKKSVRFVLFYEKNINSGEATLFSETFGRIVASTYASLGLDVSGLPFRMEATKTRSTRSPRKKR